MAIKDMYDFSLVQNEAENLVIEEIERQLTQEELTDNQEFVFDVTTLALNNTPPAYRTTLLGKLYSSRLRDSAYMEKVKKAVKNAIKKIKQNPST